MRSRTEKPERPGRIPSFFAQAMLSAYHSATFLKLIQDFYLTRIR